MLRRVAGRGGDVISFGTVRRLVCTLAIALVLAPAALADPNDPGASRFTRETAYAALDAEKYDEAVKQFRAIVTADEKQAWAWYGLGTALYAKQERAQAASAFGLAASDKKLRADARFREACARASIGQIDPALTTLEKALDAGFLDVGAMQTDESLVVLRKNGRFGELVERAKENRSRVPARQFDFCIGAWDVYDAKNQLLGKADIEQRRNGHVLHATWTATKSGADSESMSFYDPGRGRWRQIRIDDEGAVIEYLGGYYDGAMRLMGRETLASGQSVLIRSTYTEAAGGKLRHTVESSDDGGITWTRTFDGTYVRRSS